MASDADYNIYVPTNHGHAATFGMGNILNSPSEALYTQDLAMGSILPEKSPHAL